VPNVSRLIFNGYLRDAQITFLSPTRHHVASPTSVSLPNTTADAGMHRGRGASGDELEIAAKDPIFGFDRACWRQP
jgi:hypothetical protein